MQAVQCSYDRHAGAILAIFNDAIVTSTAIYDYQPRSLNNMIDWFAAKANGRFPVIGIEDDRGELMAFASYGLFRPSPAYKYSVEHSVYVHRSHRGKGLGLALMRRLIAVAQEQGYHVLVGAIDTGNAASISLHRKLGFTLAGTLEQAGFKFGRWLDLGFYQLILKTPAHPVDG